MAKPKVKSRSLRWAEAAGECRQAYEQVQEKADLLAEALMDLKVVQDEYEDWQNNLPENLQGSALGEKLSAVVDLEIESLANDPLENMGEADNLISEAEAMDLPQGFGRD